MKAPLQILVPLAGRSPFFNPDNYFFPKPLVEVGGKPMVARVVDNLKAIHPEATFIFVVQKEDVTKFSLDRTLELLTEGRCSVVALPGFTKGAACSALMAIDQIDPALPIVVANGDQVLDIDLSHLTATLIASGVDGGVVTFDSVHPRWSYVDVGSDGMVIQAAEKQVISRNAIAGFYFFKNGRAFTSALMSCVENNISVDGHFFIAPSLNEIILAGGTVLAHSMPTERYHSFYSPEKIRSFEDEVLQQSIERSRQGGTPSVNVVIPAAGEGSRFVKAGFSKPKPFIDVMAQPMIERVTQNVSVAGSHVHILVRKEHAEREADVVARLQASGSTLHHVGSLTEGTACTLLLARPAFDNDTPLLIANSDQVVDFSAEAFVQDCIQRNLDGSILVFRDKEKNPKWSFARVDSTGLVVEVAEKRAISDLATVGIYLFRRGADFVAGAIDMIARNDRVNGEFYSTHPRNAAF